MEELIYILPLQKRTSGKSSDVKILVFGWFVLDEFWQVLIEWEQEQHAIF